MDSRSTSHEPSQVSPTRPAGQWRRVAFGLLATAFGTNVSVPLLPVYRDRLGLSEESLTAIFGVYAAGLIPALLLAGPASDRFGRRPVALPCLLMAALASLLFLPAADSTPLLYLARFLQGAVSGAMFTVGNAWLQDLSRTEPSGTAARRGSAATSLGFGLGPLTGGLLGQYAPAPLALAYLVHVALVALALFVALPVAETVVGTHDRPSLRLRLPPGTRAAFWSVLVPTAFWVYTLPSVAMTVLPLLIPGRAHLVALIGVVAALTLGTAALVQPFAHLLGGWIGPAGVAAGSTGLFVASYAGGRSTALVMVGGALLGAASGLCLNAGLRLAQQLSTPATRGSLNSALFCCAYAGYGAPLLLTSTGGGTGVATPLAWLAAVVALTGGWLVLARRRTAGAAADTA